MKKYVYVALGLFLAGSMIGISRKADAQEKASGARTLQVKLHYSGTGSVDEKHKIFVVIWNTPDFMSAAVMPLAVQGATSKDGTVTFSDLASSPVYPSAAYDSTGNWDAQSGPPPSGSSLGIHSKTPGKPEPVQLEGGKTARIELAFDDSMKMP